MYILPASVECLDSILNISTTWKYKPMESIENVKWILHHYQIYLALFNKLRLLLKYFNYILNKNHTSVFYLDFILFRYIEHNNEFYKK